MYGWGLYTARDPQASAGYGQSDRDGKMAFNMVTVRFEKGDKFLDLRNLITQLPISDATAEAIRQVCPNFYHLPNQKEISKDYFGTDSKCHEIYVRALESFNIQAVIYQWSGSQSSLCPDYSQGGAFVIINQKLDAKSLDYFTRLPDKVLKEAETIQQENDPKKREAAQKKFSLGYATFKAYEKMAAARSKFSDMYSDAFKPFLSPDPKVNEAYEKQFSNETFDCTKAHDDTVTYKEDQVWDVMLEDTKLIQTLDKGLKTLLNSCQEQ
jgi:hypothetical protein